MKRTTFAIGLAVLLLSVAACGSETSPAPSESTAAVTTTPASSGSTTRATVKVPDLIGDSKSDVGSYLSQVGLTLGPETFEESDEPPNFVIRQSPEAGALVAEGTTVTVVYAEPRS